MQKAGALQAWLQGSNDRILGPGGNDVRGDAITLADYFAGLLTLGELSGWDFAAYPTCRAGWHA